MTPFDFELYVSPGARVSDLKQFLGILSVSAAVTLVDDIEGFISDGQVEQVKTVASLNGNIPFQRISPAGLPAASLIVVNGARALALGGVAYGTWRNCVDLAFSYRKKVANFFGVTYQFIDRYNSIGSPTQDSR